MQLFQSVSNHPRTDNPKTPKPQNPKTPILILKIDPKGKIFIDVEYLI